MRDRPVDAPRASPRRQLQISARLPGRPDPSLPLPAFQPETGASLLSVTCRETTFLTHVTLLRTSRMVRPHVSSGTSVNDPSVTPAVGMRKGRARTASQPYAR